MMGAVRLTCACGVAASGVHAAEAPGSSANAPCLSLHPMCGSSAIGTDTNNVIQKG